MLADPELHWRTGYSARTVAHAWEASPGLPPEIDAALGGDAKLLLALPEHKVPLPGGGHARQCDVFALVRQHGDTIAMTVEAKVNEPFGRTIGVWLRDASEGKHKRIAAIAELLALDCPIPPTLHYQLFHRTATAVVEAKRFKTDRAAMVVHSFSATDTRFGAFATFCDFLGVAAAVGTCSRRQLPDGLSLDLGWARGSQRFLAV